MRSPVAVPAAPVGPSVVAATGAAPGLETRPSSVSASAAVDGASTSTRAGVPVHAADSPGSARSTTATCSASRTAGTVPATTACSPRRHPQRGHRHPRGGRAGADRSLRLHLPAGVAAHQVVLEPSDPVAAVEVVDAVAHVDLGGRPQRAARPALGSVSARSTAGAPTSSRETSRARAARYAVELAAPRSRRRVSDRRGIRGLVTGDERAGPARQQVGHRRRQQHRRGARGRHRRRREGRGPHRVVDPVRAPGHRRRTGQRQQGERGAPPAPGTASAAGRRARHRPIVGSRAGSARRSPPGSSRPRAHPPQQRRPEPRTRRARPAPARRSPARRAPPRRAG